MIEIDKLTNNGNGADGALQSKTESRFRLIVVASLRAKQLQRGAHARIEADPRRRRNTSIALEEVRQGLVPFTLTHKVQEKAPVDE
jgi:DNA-directed RNA polymerase omega subunit